MAAILIALTYAIHPKLLTQSWIMVYDSHVLASLATTSLQTWLLEKQSPYVFIMKSLVFN